MSLPPYRGALRNIVQLFQSCPYSSDLDLTTQIRNWVNTHSVHLIDDEHDSYAFDVPRVLEKLWLRSSGIIDKPHLSCGPRAYAMKEIVDALGIESRIIDIFAINDKSIRSHTLLEVFDRQQQRWIMQDPDFNVYYILQSNARVLSALEMLSEDKNTVLFSTGGFNVENEINCNNTITQLFELGILYRFSYVGERSLVLWSSTKFDVIVNVNASDYTILDYFFRRDYRPKIEAVTTSLVVANKNIEVISS